MPTNPTNTPAQPPTPTPPTPVNGPRWVCDTPTQDFGSVWVGVKIEKKYTFRNGGNQVLKIDEPKPHCSCSSTPEYTKEVPPGGTGTIPFVMQTTNKPNGPVNEYLTIPTNDPANPEVKIWLTGTIRTVCSEEVTFDALYERDKAAGKEVQPVEKMKGAFGKIKADDQLYRVIKLRNTSGQPLMLTLLPPPPGSKFTGEFKETLPGQEFELTIRGEPPFPSGYSTTAFQFTTNVADQPSYVLYASAEVPPRIEIIPTKIVYDPKKYGNPSRPIRILNHGTTPIEVTAISTSDPQYMISLQPRTPGKPEETVISVVLPSGDYRIPPYGEMIEIRTTDPEKALIQIQVCPSMDPPTARPPDKPLLMTPVAMPGKG